MRAVDHKALGEVVQESMHNLLALGSVSFDEVAMARQFLEVPTAEQAALHRTEDDVAELRAIINEQRIRSVGDPDISELDAQFHIAVARMSGNRILASLVYALHRESEPVSYLDLSPEVGRSTYKQHQKIVNAIDNQDEHAAGEAITEHLTYLRAHLADHLKSTGRVPGSSLN